MFKGWGLIDSIVKIFWSVFYQYLEDVINREKSDVNEGQETQIRFYLF